MYLKGFWRFYSKSIKKFALSKKVEISHIEIIVSTIINPNGNPFISLKDSGKYLLPPPITSKKVSESPTGDRTAFVIKACKQITDILPFAQKGQSLLDEPELIKYLMLSLPLNPRSVTIGVIVL